MRLIRAAALATTALALTLALACQTKTQKEIVSYNDEILKMKDNELATMDKLNKALATVNALTSKTLRDDIAPALKGEIDKLKAIAPKSDDLKGFNDRYIADLQKMQDSVAAIADALDKQDLDAAKKAVDDLHAAGDDSTKVITDFYDFAEKHGLKKKS